MNLINVHTHIFNLENAPDDFVGGFVPKSLRKLAVKIIHNKLARKLLIAALKRLGPGSQRLASFISVGLFKRQEDIFEDLRSNYSDNSRFVVLTLNMDHMSVAPPKNFFTHQIRDVQLLRQKYPNRCLPFYSCDPRSGTGAELFANVKEHVVHRGNGNDGAFIGLKLYPALGFYPFDRDLELVYEYAANHNLPIMTHCTRSGAYYLGRISGSMTRPDSFCGYPMSYKELEGWDMINFLTLRAGRRTKNKDFCDNFLHPLNYYGVLKHFEKKGKKLKICFAHLGGVPEIKKSEKVSWFHMILFLMRTFPGQVYADVSYTLYDKDIFDELVGVMKDARYKDQLLFGTDYFMTLKEKSEASLVGDFTTYLSEVNAMEEFRKMAGENAKRYLSSGVFECK
ncbi:MAG: amidohydrolase family protein [Flavobacteriales bacterium]|nr:amidohydrolase family protein [Flavobacteriales bacterium]